MMTNQESKIIIRRLCNHATQVANMNGINVDFENLLVLSLHDNPYNKFRIGVNVGFDKYEPNFYMLDAIFNADGLNFWNKFNGNFYFFNQDEFVHRINDTNWCVILDKLIEHAGSCFEFPNPNESYWKQKLEDLINEIHSKAEAIRLKLKTKGEDLFSSTEYKALLNKYRPLIIITKDDIKIHAPPIRIPLVPENIANIEQLMIWLEINNVE